MDEQEISTAIATILNLPRDRVFPAARLRELVPESFALVEMVIDLQDQAGVAFTQGDFRGVETVADLLKLFQSHGSHRPA